MHNPYFIVNVILMLSVLNNIEAFNETVYSNSISILYNRKLNVLVEVHPPFISYSSKSGRFGGIEFLILQLISKHMNRELVLTIANNSTAFLEVDFE